MAPDAKAASAGEAPAPSIHARYAIVRELGRGGVGAVYAARELATGRMVALKTLEAVTATTQTLFEREYHVLASLSHPSVIRVFDYGFTDDGKRYYTMEVLPGSDIVEMAPMPWREACLHLRRIAASLSLLHCRRLLHRDVSPRNIRLDEHGHAKLLDFGALTSFGVPSEVVGTPGFIAPESVRKAELDQRSDLFSLGAVFYLALTGHKPFRVKSAREMEAAVRERPAAISSLVAEVPVALDQLILSMISADPSGRPGSAAEVFERVSAIAGLSDEPGTEVGESHLVSGSLVGREREKHQLEQQLEHATNGQGGVLVLDGAAGMGKSQLAFETLLEARLLGMTTVCVDAMAHIAPLGVIHAISRALSDLFPGERPEALRSHRPVALVAAEAGAERLAVIQNQLVIWALAIAARVPLLIVIDNVHAADPTSLGALTALGHRAREARLLLLLTQLAESQKEPAAAPSLQMQQLVRLAARIKLRGLTQAAVAQLVQHAFGDAPNGARLTQWLFDVGHGNPGQSIELLTHLLREGMIRYSGGAWLLPVELADAAIPRSREQVLRLRVQALDPVAARLAHLPAIHRGPLAVSVCARALRDVPRDAFDAALEAVSARQIVVVAGEQCRIRDDTLRALLLADMSSEELRQLHLALGQALLDLSPAAGGDFDSASASTAQLLDMLQAGSHFIHGGEGDMGRGLLKAAGIELTRRGEGLATAIPALESALAAYLEQGRSEYECAHLQIPLTLAGTFVDFRLTYKHGDRLMLTLADVGGIGLARKLGRALGRHLGLLIALGIAAARFPFTPRRHLGRSFAEALLGLIGMGAAIAGACSTLMDGVLARRIVDLLSPLGAVPNLIPVRTAYEFQLCLLDCALGNYAQCYRRAHAVLERLRRKSWLLPEGARAQLEFGVYIVLASMDTYRTDGRIHESIDALERMHTSHSLQTAAGMRASYHAFRGERLLFERYQREVDVLAAQLGSTWRQDVLFARNLWWFHALSEDVIGLKQCLRSLEILARDAPALVPSRDAAAAMYLASRGQHEAALEQYGSTLAAAAVSGNEIAMRYVTTLAHLERLCGEPDRAERRCREALAALRPEQREFEVTIHGARVEQILALSQLRRDGEAVALVEQLLADQEKHDNPLLRGLSHKTAARVALAMRDADRFGKHLASMRYWFARSESASLIAQCHALGEHGVRAGLSFDAAAPASPSRRELAPEASAARERFARCRGPAERLQTALDILVAVSGAERGYLYLAEAEGSLRFVAPTTGMEPADDVRSELAARLQERCAADVDSPTEVLASVEQLRTVVEPDDGFAVAATGERYKGIFLLLAEASGTVAVGAVALAAAGQALRSVECSVIEEVSRSIYGAADVRTVYARFESPSQRPPLA